MKQWTMSYRGQTKPLAEWGISNVTRHILNQGTDTVTFQTDASAPVFECDAIIEVFQDNTRWFWGRITQTPTYYTADSESAYYKASGPFWYFEHLVFQQPWRYFKDGTATTTEVINRSVCLLGQDDQGNTINARQCLQAIVDYAKAHHAPIECGTISGFDFEFPCETIKDCSCSEAILKLLRWTPNATAWIDYTTKTPTIHFACASALQKQSLSLRQLTQFSIIPRNDLKIAAVVLKYEHSHSADGATWKSVTVDRYPENATGEELNALVLTVEWEGSHAHVQEQWVQTQPIQPESDDWWKKHFPCLVDAKSIQISNVQRMSNLPNELLEGAIAPWMGCDATYETISASIHYVTDEMDTERPFSVKICATNAQSRIYQNVISSGKTTQPPVGLATTLYQSIGCLRYEGQLTLIDEDLSGPFIGHALSFLDGEPMWATLSLPVQEERISLDTGTTVLKFGAPKQLGPNDICQLMHTHRIRTITDNPKMRFADQRSGDRTYFPHMSPISDSQVDMGRYTQLTIGTKSKQVMINANALPENTQLSLKPFNMVENGELKQFWMIASR